MPSVTANIQVRGLDEIQRAFQKFEAEVRKTAPQSVKLTAQATLNAFSGTTRKAPPKREVKELTRKTGAKHVNWATGTLDAETAKHFAIKFWHNGHIKLRLLPYSITKRSEANKSPLRNIGYRGLAKKSWWFTGKRSGVKTTDTGTSEMARSAADLAASGSKSDLKGDNPFVFISNALAYISKSFYTTGDHTVASVAHRAERWLEERLKRDAAKAAKAAS